MHKPRLFERIKAWENKEICKFNNVDEHTLTQSILLHLEKMLNTKKGSTMICQNYGLSEFNALQQGTMEQEIKQFIQRYEPRLEISDVIRLPQQKNTAANISIQIAGALTHGKQPIHFTTMLTPSGKITVQL